MNDFLPQGYSVPEAQGNYLKLKDGPNKFRVVGNPIFGFEYWTENNKPVRLKKEPKERPADIRIEKDGSYKIKHFWAMPVIDRAENRIKIYEITQVTIMRAIESLLKNEDWGDPANYDITIEKSGQNLDTTYNVQPSPHKELSEADKKLVAETKVHLEALFYGENPFSENWSAPVEIVEPEDEVNIKDVPF